MEERANRVGARWAGGILGLALALVLIVASQPGAVSSTLPATLRFSVAPSGELEATPPSPKPFLLADSLRPGARASEGSLALRNQTGEDLVVALRARPNSPALNGLVRVRLARDRAVLSRTTLQGLAQHPARLVLASGEATRVRLRAWIPSEVTGGYEGRVVRASLVPEVRPGGRAR